MTPPSTGPYTRDAIRFLIATCVFALTSCATDSASRAELGELTLSVRALRAENARIEARLEKLERQGKVAEAPRPASGARTRAATPPDQLPPLTVVRLKPRQDASPRLNTVVEVVEPPESLADVASEKPQPDDEAEEAVDDAIAVGQYERGLDALKTGDVEGGIAQLQQFAADWPKHPRADNALYFAGIGLMTSGEVEGAATVLSQSIARYPAGDAMLDSLLKLAECRLKLKRPNEARETFRRIVANFPGTVAATQAQAKLATLNASP